MKTNLLSDRLSIVPAPFIKKIILAATVLILFTNCSQGQNGVPQAFVPFHQLLQNHRALQNGNVGRSKAQGEIACVHDKWNTPTWGWVHADSCNYNYNSRALETGNTSYIFSSQQWFGHVKTVYTYDGDGNEIGCVVQSCNNSTWQNFSNYIATYNNAGKVLSQTYQVWSADAGIWLNTNQFIFTYDAANNLTQELDQIWHNGTWLNFQKFTSTYTYSNQLITETLQRWSAANNNWNNFTNTNHSYDNAGNETDRVEQAWCQQAWRNYFHHNYAYDAAHNDTLQTTQYWDTTANAWINRAKYSYAFDANHNATRLTDYNWDVVTTAWVPDFNNTYTYNTNNQPVQIVEQNWDINAGALLNANKSIYTYDVANNNTQYENFTWDNVAANWVPYTLTAYTFDADNNNIYELDQIYNTAAATYVNTDQYYFYYPPSAASAITENTNGIVANVYPNPVTGNQITLQLNFSNNAPITLSTYNATAQLINSQTQSVTAGGSITINYPTLPAGIYLIQAAETTGNKSTAIKFVKN